MNTHEVSYNVIQKPLNERLKDACCLYWGVSIDFFYSTEKANEPEKRHIFFYLQNRVAGESYRSLERRYGLKHSSIFEGCEKISVIKNIYPHVTRALRDIQAIAEKLDTNIITVPIALDSVRPKPVEGL